MAGFEVADQDPAPLFESSSLRGVFDVRSAPASARLICSRIVHAHTRGWVPDGAEQAHTPRLLPPPAGDVREVSAAQKRQRDFVNLLLSRVANTKRYVIMPEVEVGRMHLSAAR